MKIYKYNIPLGLTLEVSLFPSTDEDLKLFVQTQNIGVLTEYFWFVPEWRHAHD